MSKKAKKAARELERLQNLYRQSNTSTPIGAPQTVVHQPTASGGTSSVVSSHSYAYVKRDLGLLLILLVVMVAGLIGLNLLAGSTAFGDVLAKLVGRLF